ncbi:MAG: FAD-dependent oxidoreductase [Pseudomonadota bacterium]
MLRRRKKPKIAVIGGGPAGLSVARFLNETRKVDVTVFEAASQLGGKSFTFSENGVVCEMGTCYATRNDIHVRKWIRSLGIKARSLGDQLIDGGPYFDWVKEPGTMSIYQELLIYRKASNRLKKLLVTQPDDPSVLNEAGMPILYWLRARGLAKMERLHYRALTNMGYGRLDETSTIQALRWIDIPLLMSARFNGLMMPTTGWTDLWERVSQNVDVRLDHRVTAVERQADGVILEAGGEEHRFDKLVCAIPVDDFSALTTPTEAELRVNESVRWNGYATTLMQVNDWFHEEQLRCWSSAIMLDSEPGQLMSARYEVDSPDFGGRLYVLNQISGEYNERELNELAEGDVRRDGGTPVRAILTKRWKYFAQYKPGTVSEGLLTHLRDMQGEANTYYTGATFSHESVATITRFNHSLAKAIVADRHRKAAAP